MAQYEDFIADQGADLAIQLELANANGSVKNLSGKTFTGSIKKTFNTADSDAITFGTTVTSVLLGQVTLSLTNVQTSAMNSGRYFYDVEMSYVDSAADTIIERVLEGKLEITPSVIS